MRFLKKWHGSWSDGKSAASVKVEVTLLEDKLAIYTISEPSVKSYFWSYDKIHSPNPVSRRADHVLLTHEDHEGERLFIDEPDFAAHILKHATRITARSHSWAMLKWPLGMTAALVIFWALTFFNIISPSATIANMLPDKARTSLGNGVIKTIAKDRKICQSPEGNAALEKMVARLKEGASKKIPFTFEVADLKIVNAFAAPGDRIVISGKLIETAKSPAEVAGVVAHEMGHAIERHPETNLVRALGLMTIMQLFTAGEAGTLGDVAFYLVQSGYSRQAETEADKHAAKILKKSTIDSRPLAGFFERIIALHRLKENNKNGGVKDKEEENSKQIPDGSDPAKSANSPSTDKKYTSTITEWISTHPPTNKRIEYFNQSSISTNPPILTATEWAALQKICNK